VLPRAAVRRSVPRSGQDAHHDSMGTSQRVPLRERCFWLLLYDSAPRSAEVLRLDMPDMDLASHRARVTRKGGGHDVIIWKSRTARLLPDYLARRRDGPVFLTERARSRTRCPVRVTGMSRAGRGCPRAGRDAVPRVVGCPARPGRDAAPAAALGADP
jgi:integrase